MGPKAWMQRLRSLGQALVELWQAELDALGTDLKSSARELARGIALLILAAFFLFWVVGGLIYGSVEVLSLWLPRWGAVFSVTGFWALVALVLALLGRARIRRLEGPAQTVRRRVASHRAFVEKELLSEPGKGEPKVVQPRLETEAPASDPPEGQA